ncbi:DddA-like double-stranded DNA deaminase toxin [Amycolatopsis sp. cmx-8-4]|uniref:DddA-like double-stranded DNA deaminase toxin n=1 Tax=Amycolatopsis sp. cmx-8-4 TaxID=2790947 RepID=UPI00397BE59E
MADQGASVGDLARRLSAVLAQLPSDALEQASQNLGDAHTRIEEVSRGSADPGLRSAADLLAQALVLARVVGEGVAESRRLLQEYLDRLGPATSQPTRPAVTGPSLSLGERVRQARRRVGRRDDGVVPARGEWVRSDGWTVRMASGPGDDHFSAARRFIGSHLPGPVARLATHVEVKVAVRMREEHLSQETVVMDRGVCGTRPFDSHRRITCDKFLPALLPPGAVLRVVQPDGTIREYQGGEPA